MATYNVPVEWSSLGLESRPYTRSLTLTGLAIALAAATANAGVATVNADALRFRVNLPANCRIKDAILVVHEGLGDVSDTAFDDLTASSGDDAGDLEFIVATQVAALAGGLVRIAGTNRLGGLTLGNINGAVAALSIGAAYVQAEVTALRNAVETLADDVRAGFARLAGGKVYTAANHLTLLITPEAGKNLLNLDRGEIRLYAEFEQAGQLG